MTNQSTSQSTHVDHPQIAEEATLIVNFYGERGKLPALIDYLVQSLALTPQGRDSYANEITGALLRYFDPSAASAHDTTIVQLVLNKSGEAAVTWEAMREQMEAILRDDDLLKNVWGYTLIYQAELVQDVPLETTYPVLVPIALRLHPSLSENPQILAQSAMPGGLLWLIDIPNKGDGLQAAMVYLALSEPNTHNRLVRDVLYNPIAALLMVDLIAHKGYHQMRQYRFDDLDQQYRRNIDTLSRHTDTLLHDLTRVSVADSQLDDLAREYGLLTSAVVHLDQLHVSLLRQTANFHWWREQAHGGDVVAFHHRSLEEATRELEFLVAEGQHPLDAARTAVEMVRARLDKQQESQQKRIETILTSAAAILSVLVLIDKDTARSLLELIGIPQPIGIWPVLGVQVVFVIIASLLTVFVLKRILHGRRSGTFR